MATVKNKSSWQTKMRAFGSAVYSCWASFWFVTIYLLLFPVFFIIIQHKPWHKYCEHLNKTWAYLLHLFVFIPLVRIERSKLDTKKAYLYCANHTSYVDIPTMSVAARQHIVFVGKNSLSSIPLFGYMFRKLHIPIDRGNARNSLKSLEKAKATLLEGQSVAIFPEGGIKTTRPPQLTPFKDGAFKVAIETKMPIVPVTIVNNWKMEFEPGQSLVWQPIKVVIHEPIYTEHLTAADQDRLKWQVYETIRKELLAHFPEHAERLQPPQGALNNSAFS